MQSVKNKLQYKYISAGEGQEVKKISFKDLKANVAVLASALKRLGVKKGDRIAGMKTGFIWSLVCWLLNQQYYFITSRLSA